jgi:capsular polysaccharide biosynthesis protein
VSRLSDATQRPGYRVLRNEAALIEALAGIGFVAIEPASLPFEKQVRAFADASVVVGLGGAGMFNVAFCRERTKVVTIEASEAFITGHTGLFASLELPYGVIYGRQDDRDDGRSNPHLPWSVDVERAVAAVRDFL